MGYESFKAMRSDSDMIGGRALRLGQTKEPSAVATDLNMNMVFYIFYVC